MHPFNHIWKLQSASLTILLAMEEKHPWFWTLKCNNAQDDIKEAVLKEKFTNHFWTAVSGWFLITTATPWARKETSWKPRDKKIGKLKQMPQIEKFHYRCQQLSQGFYYPHQHSCKVLQALLPAKFHQRQLYTWSQAEKMWGTSILNALNIKDN